MSCRHISINSRIGNISEQLCSAIMRNRQVKKFRMFINKVNVIISAFKQGAGQYVNEEADICLNTADTEFLQYANHLLYGTGMSQIICRSLNKQGIVIRCNDSPRISIAAVKTNPEAAAATICNNLTRIGHKAVQRIFRRNTALNGIAYTLYRFLRRNTYLLTIQRIAFGNLNLRLHNIDACNHFRYRMFNLNTRVNFNKVEFFIACNEEFYRARIDIVDVFHQLQGRITNVLTQFFRKRKSRCNFNHLLMTPLNGTISFEKMDYIAVFIPHDLYFNMLGIDNAFFQVNFITAESKLRFGFSTFICILKIGHFIDHTHAATATAVNSL